MVHPVIWKKNQKTDITGKLSCLFVGHKYSPIWKSNDNTESFSVEDKSLIRCVVPARGYFVCERCQHRATKEEYLK